MLRVGTGTSAEGFGIDSRFGEDRYEWRLVLSAGSRVGVRRAEPLVLLGQQESPVGERTAGLFSWDLLRDGAVARAREFATGCGSWRSGHARVQREAERLTRWLTQRAESGGGVTRW